MKVIVVILMCLISASSYSGSISIEKEREAVVFFTSSMGSTPPGDAGWSIRRFCLICDVNNAVDNTGYIDVSANRPDQGNPLLMSYDTCNPAGCGRLYGPKIYLTKDNTKIVILVAPIHAGIIFNNHSNQTLTVSCMLSEKTCPF